MNARTRPTISPVPAARTGPPLISICIPTLNRARYLKETIPNLLPQIGPDVELLIYDTGSEDGTRELMKEFIAQYPRLRFFALDVRRGVDETLLLLLEKSTGEYVWFFGSDDLLKPGAVDEVRQRILRSPSRPSFIYVNHEVVDDAGKLLIPSNVGSLKDREFKDGYQCAAWLGLYLGYISSCIFRRKDCEPIEAARKFIGSLWLGLSLNLNSLSKSGPAIYIGQPLVSARRNPANTYDYATIFVRNASDVFLASGRQGLGFFAARRAMNTTVKAIYPPLCLAWRCDDPLVFRQVFAAMLDTCWMYPWFWLLIVPIRFSPASLLRTVRQRLRARRERRNNSIQSRTGNLPVYSSCPPAVFQEPFRAGKGKS